MNKTPTAEELAIEMLLKGSTEYSSFNRVTFTGKELKELAIELAKLHVQEAQKAWFDKIKSEGLVTEAGIAYLENAYSLDLIK